MIQLTAGERVGNYRITGFLARGGFALTYLADDEMNNLVVLKFGDKSGGGKYVARFLEITDTRRPDGISADETPAEAFFFRDHGVRIDFLDFHEVDCFLREEAQMLGQVNHPNMARVHELIMHEGRPVIVIEYAKGRTLREKIRNLESIKVNWFLKIVRALKKLRSAGTLSYHGDLKPENIVIKHSGSVIMLDPAPRKDGRGIVITTPYYNPLLLTDSKADVMAIGAMLYEILTGISPFNEVPWQYAGHAQGGEIERLSLSYFLSYPPIKELNPSAPDELVKIVYRCLTIMPYGLEELEKDLVSFLQKSG